MAHAATNEVIEVNRGDPRRSRRTEAPLHPLEDGQVRLRIDRLALTANNVSYALAGDALGYWDFFPTGDERWGRVPAMGWADVVESTHPGVEVGGRYYGWYPMAGHVDVTVAPTRDGLRDDGAHRSGHAPVYRSYVDTRTDPTYPGQGGPLDPAVLGDAEDRHALLRGLFLTGFLADEYFAAGDYFGADAVIVLSASSKTAIGFAQRAAERGIDVIGVTSAGNAEFVRSLDGYHRVIGYDELDRLPRRPAVSVDLAGNRTALAALHDHLGDELAYSMVIGNSHHPDGGPTVTSGPRPRFFFAPTEAARRVEAWGQEEFQRRYRVALDSFIAGSERWLTVERTAGADAIGEVWRQVHDGKVSPATGYIISLPA